MHVCQEMAHRWDVGAPQRGAARALARTAGQMITGRGVAQGGQGGGLAEFRAAEGFPGAAVEPWVGRTFAWIGHNRRMAKGYERLCATEEAYVYVAMRRLMVRRLASA